MTSFLQLYRSQQMILSRDRMQIYNGGYNNVQTIQLQGVFQELTQPPLSLTVSF